MLDEAAYQCLCVQFLHCAGVEQGTAERVRGAEHNRIICSDDVRQGDGPRCADLACDVIDQRRSA
jgi:hypothetical protein